MSCMAPVPECYAAWDDGDELIFQIENRLDHDTAPAIQAPTSDRLSGRGLWLASHLVDDLAIEVTADNAIVRLHLASTKPTQVSCTTPSRVPSRVIHSSPAPPGAPRLHGGLARTHRPGGRAVIPLPHLV